VGKKTSVTWMYFYLTTLKGHLSAYEVNMKNSEIKDGGRWTLNYQLDLAVPED
jgi:hypothetical protein